MRTVFGNSMVAHVWAQQQQASGTNTKRSLFFEGDTLYSYRRNYPIARIVAAADGTLAVLIRSSAYSVTTARHIYEARAATRHLVSYSVHNVTDTPAASLADQHLTAISEAEAEVDARKGKWKTLERRLLGAAHALDVLASYCSTFGLANPVSAEGREALLGKVRDAYLAYNDPAKEARRAKGRERRRAKMQLAGDLAMVALHAYLEGVGPALQNSQYKVLSLDDQRRYRAAYTTANAKAIPARITLGEWQAGLGDAVTYSLPPGTWLRRKGQRLETSHGAEVPWSHAVLAFVAAQRCRATGTAWYRTSDTIHGIRVGHFQVDRIDAEGNMTAACHRLGWGEMLRLAIKEVPQVVRPQYPLPVIVPLEDRVNAKIQAVAAHLYSRANKARG